MRDRLTNEKPGQLDIQIVESARSYVEKAAAFLRRADLLVKDAVHDYWNAGQQLIEAKANTAHGEWLPLLADEEIGERTARNLMQLAREFESPAAVMAAGGYAAAIKQLHSPKTATVAVLAPPSTSPSPPSQAGQVVVAGKDTAEATEPVAGGRAAVRAGTLTAKDAAEDTEPVDAKAAGRAAAEDTEPVADARAQAMQRIDDLEDENKMLTARDSEQEHERHKAFNQLQAVNGGLRSSVHEWQTKYADLQRSHRGALKVIKELEGKPAQLGDVQQRVADLEDEVKFWQGETSDHDHERQAVFNRQQAVIGALRAELATERGHHNDLKAAHRGAIKRIRELEGTV